MQARASAIDHLVEVGVLEMPEGSTSELPALNPAEDATSQAVEERLAALRREADLS